MGGVAADVETIVTSDLVDEVRAVLLLFLSARFVVVGTHGGYRHHLLLHLGLGQHGVLQVGVDHRPRLVRCWGETE